MKTVQNFYKQTLPIAWTTGTGIRYVSTKPTPSSGWLVISPNNSSKREIVAYSSTGTDGTGDYVVVSARGVGGTTEQGHDIGEKIRMNITAEYWDDITASIEVVQTNLDNAVLAGASHASDVVEGISFLSVAPASPTNPISVGTNDPRVPTADITAALAGTSGTPSGTNKYVTNDDTSTTGVIGKVVRANGSGKIDSTFISIPSLPTTTYQQMIQPGTNITDLIVEFTGTSNTTGSIMVNYTKYATEHKLQRFSRDTNTGLYVMTHDVTISSVGTGGAGVCILGSFVYVFGDTGSTTVCYRYALSDLTGETAMTFVTPVSQSDTIGVRAYTDGTYLYFQENGSSSGATYHKVSVSGTSLTEISTTAVTSELAGNKAIGFTYDGTNIYVFDGVALLRLNNVDGTAVTVVKSITSTLLMNMTSVSGLRGAVYAIDSSRLYYGGLNNNIVDNGTDVLNILVINPISNS